MRLIDADALTEEMNKKALDLANGGMIFIETINNVIDNAPTVEAKTTADCIIAYGDGYETARRLSERPQGEWKRHDEWRNGEYIGGFYHVNCPCEDGYYSKWETNFCPNCGAEMKGGAE